MGEKGKKFLSGIPSPGPLSPAYGVENMVKDDRIKCEKCGKQDTFENMECVYYSTHEGYLCKNCYQEWLKIDKSIPTKNNNYKTHEKRYLEWIKIKS